MKILLALILFCAASHGADIYTTNVVGDITTVIAERQDTNGMPTVQFETLYRGKQKIFQTMSLPTKQGKLMLVSRTYFAGGKGVMIESDEDRDGVFEHLSVHNIATDEFEIFVKRPDGSVVPESTKKIELMKKENAVVGEAMRNLLNRSSPSDQEISNTLQESHQKIQDLQKQESNDKH